MPVAYNSKAYKWLQNGDHDTVYNNCSGDDRYAFLTLFFRDGVSGLSCTYGGVPMTFLDSVAGHLITYGIIAPKTGNQPVTASWTTWRSVKFHVATFTGVNPLDPLGTKQEASGIATSKGVTLASAVGELCYSAGYYSTGSGETITVGAGQTTLHNNSSNPAGANSYEAGAASVYCSYSGPSSLWWEVHGWPLHMAPVIGGRRSTKMAGF